MTNCLRAPTDAGPKHSSGARDISPLQYRMFDGAKCWKYHPNLPQGSESTHNVRRLRTCAVFELNHLEPAFCRTPVRRLRPVRKRTILARANVQAHSLPWPDGVGSTTGHLCFVESSWLRSFGLVWFVRGLARVGLTYVGLFGCVGIVFHFR